MLQYLLSFSSSVAIIFWVELSITEMEINTSFNENVSVIFVGLAWLFFLKKILVRHGTNVLSFPSFFFLFFFSTYFLFNSYTKGRTHEMIFIKKATANTRDPFAIEEEEED